MNESSTDKGQTPEYRVTKAEYVITAPNINFCPPPDRAEVAIAGRSNVGKSSLINLISNHKQLARTSSTPGKTRTLNYFNLVIEPETILFYLVDLPGYGYAKVSKKIKADWDEALSIYLAERTSLVGLIHLIDSRHKPTQQDKMMREWTQFNKMPVITVLTKIDKLSKNQRQKQISLIKKELQIGPEESMVPVSVMTKEGIQAFLRALVHLLQTAPVP